MTATLSGLTITGGSAGVGGGLENDGTVTLTDCTSAATRRHLSGGGGGVEYRHTDGLLYCTLGSNSGRLRRRHATTRYLIDACTDSHLCGELRPASVRSASTPAGTATFTNSLPSQRKLRRARRRQRG